ncbi:MAG: tetratricopeptide repeat protein [Candidatus Promineifilaceae bacterium]
MNDNDEMAPEGFDSEAQESAFTNAFRKGTWLLHNGNAAEAAPLLERAYQLRPDEVDAGINLAGAYILTKKFSKATAILEPLSDKYPDHAMVWTNLGAAYLGNPVLAGEEHQLRAIDAFKRALAIDPLSPSVAYNIGLIYRDRGDKDKAIHWFQRALETNPLDEHARNILTKLEAG